MSTSDTMITGIDAGRLVSAGLGAWVVLCRRRFWDFALEVKTQDENVGRIRGFPRFGFLEGCHEFLVCSKVGLILKSRQMLVSYLAMLDKLWSAWRCDGGSGETYFGAAISKREEDAIHLLERVKFMYGTLPQALRDYNPILKSTLTYLEFARGGKLKVLPASEDIGRTYTFTDILFDEFAFAPWDRKMWSSLRPTIGVGGRMHAVSTPNGKFNMFHDMWMDESHYVGIGRHRLHWSSHPERGESWASEMRSTMPEETWMREYELSFATMAGKRVYGEFSEQVHVRDFETSPRNGIVYRVWDFGYHHPAVLWLFRNGRDQLCARREFMGEDVDTRTFAAEVIELSEAYFHGCRYRDFCDIAGHQKQSAVGKADAKSDIEVLRGLGIEPRAKKFGVRQTIELVRQLLKLRSDGEPWLLVHPDCRILIEGFSGGYCFDDREVMKEEPKGDGYYEHLHDILRYAVGFLYKEIVGEMRGSVVQRRQSYEERAAYMDPGFGGF